MVFPENRSKTGVRKCFGSHESKAGIKVYRKTFCLIAVTCAMISS